MSKDEINKLLKEIKVLYPRFDSVVKDNLDFYVSPGVTNAWWNRIGWMDYDRALKILDRHMESENGSKTPGLALWINNGKAQQRAEGYESATLDRRHGVIRWQPEPNGDVYERPCNFNQHLGCWEDNEGYLWATPGE